METSQVFLRTGTLEWEKIKGPKNTNLVAGFTQAQQDKLFNEAGVLEFDLALTELAGKNNTVLIQLRNLSFNKPGDKFANTSLAGDAKVSEIKLQLVGGPHHNAKIKADLDVSAYWSNDQYFGNPKPVANAFDQDPETYWEMEPSSTPLALLLQIDGALPEKDKGTRLRIRMEYEEDAFPLVQNNAMTVAVTESESPLFEASNGLSPYSLLAIVPDKDRARYNDQLSLAMAVASEKRDAEIFEDWAELREELYALNSRSVRVAVMQENANPRPTFVLDRGAYDAPLKDQPVGREIPVVFGKANEEYPKNRLGLLIGWLQDDNPLTARVTVNRYWQMIFGNGLVITSEDFGAQGELPSHPKLLDYLAVAFIESGWDTKKLIRDFVTSSTYRQQSVRRPEMDIADPENRLLSWFPRQRLQAEFIRDNALAASGLLVPKIGGPSVKPYQPDGLWKEKAMRKNSPTGFFTRDSGENLYRRGMYTFWKQVAPPPQMEAFDAPAREVCITKRNTTNTPMQALTLLNDETYLEASRKMAERLIVEVPGAWDDTLDERIVLGYRYLTGRKPSDRGLEILRELTLKSYQNFSAEDADPEGFLSYGESKTMESIDPVEHASLAFTTSALLNLDKTITRD